MDGSEYISTTAELGVGLAGFAALFIAIRGPESSSLSQVDRLLIANLIERGLVAALMSLLPILLFGLSFPESIVWFLLSGTFAIYGIALAIRSTSNFKRNPNRLISAPWFYTLALMGMAMVVLQLMHAFGLGIHQSVWWYLVAVTWLLFTAGYWFFFVLLRWIHAD